MSIVASGAKAGRIGVLADGSRRVVISTGPASRLGGAVLFRPPAHQQIAVADVDSRGVTRAVRMLDNADRDEVLVDASISADGRLCALGARDAGLVLHFVDGSGETSTELQASTPAFVRLAGDGCLVNATAADETVRLARFGPEGEQWHVETRPGEAGPLASAPDGTVVATARNLSGDAHGVDAHGNSFDGVGDSPALELLQVDADGRLVDFAFQFDVDVVPADIAAMDGQWVISGSCGSRACVVTDDELELKVVASLASVGGGEFSRLLTLPTGDLLVGGRAAGAIGAIAGNLGHAAVTSTLRDGTLSTQWVPSTVASAVVDVAAGPDGDLSYLVSFSGVALRHGEPLSTEGVSLALSSSEDFSAPDVGRQSLEVDDVAPPIIVDLPPTTGSQTVLSRHGDGFAMTLGSSSGTVTQGDVTTVVLTDARNDLVEVDIDATGRVLGASVDDIGDDERVVSDDRAADGTRCLVVANSVEQTVILTRPDGTTTRSTTQMTPLGAGVGGRCLFSRAGSVFVLDEEGVHVAFEAPVTRLAMRRDGVLVGVGNAVSATIVRDDVSSVEVEAGHAFVVVKSTSNLRVDVLPIDAGATDARVFDSALLNDGTVILSAVSLERVDSSSFRTLETFVVAYDADGAQRWRRDLHKAGCVELDADGDAVIVRGAAPVDLELSPGVVVPGTEWRDGCLGATSFVVSLDSAGVVHEVRWLLNGGIFGVAPGPRTLVALFSPGIHGAGDTLDLVNGPMHVDSAGSLLIIDGDMMPTISFRSEVTPQQ